MNCVILPLYRLGGLLLLVALLSGCVRRREYFDYRHGNGYGQRGFISGPPVMHGFNNNRWDLTYTPLRGKRRVVWPYINSYPGPYTGPVVHDDLIIFLELFRYDELNSKVFAAKAGAPAVEITGSAFRAAQHGSGVSIPADVRYYFSKAEPTESGVRMHFQLFSPARDFPDKLSGVLTWQELEGLVTNLRATGQVRSRHGVKYYVEK